jgi:hypothetical protein
LPCKIDEICPRQAEFSLRFPKSDRLLIWLSVVKKIKYLPANFCKRLCNFYLYRASAGAEPWVATFDHSDIRGLDTARPVFVAELPLSSGGSSVNLSP